MCKKSKRGDQWARCSAVSFGGEARFSREIYSERRFFHWAKFREFLDFQFKRIVFLAMVRATRRSLFVLVWKLSEDTSPSKQSEGDKGMWHSRKRDRDSVTFF